MNSYPVDAILPELKEAVLRNPALILHAPPGAGKTTRVPLALLDGISPQGRIVMLEPRRIAAVSAARWMAQTIGEEIGKTIGYSIRFESRLSEETRIEVVTEGVLTRRIQADPALEGVAMIIFDEFHERSLQADLALALCLDIRGSIREDLRMLFMSATLDYGPLSALLGGAPVISCGGQAFPVEERYLAETQKPLTERVVRAVDTALRETAGGILVFLPGSREIRACSEALSPLADRRGGITLHPLFGDLPFEEQERAILPSQGRKIVLATNIAETSLTIEGVSAVIDAGLTRRLRYDPSTGMNRLITLKTSRASADQRKGRAGRIGPGVCYRLYSPQTLHSMLPFSSPEILVSDLSSLALELAIWGPKDPSALQWLNAPPAAAWSAALTLLRDIGAIDEAGAVTSRGRAMVRLPLHPRLGRLLIRAIEMGSPGLGADLGALLSERDIMRRSGRESTAGTREEDISERLDILHRWRKEKRDHGMADPWAVRAVDRTAGQLLRLTGQRREDSEEARAGDIVGSILLAAFPDRIARLREDGDGRFVLMQGRGVRLSPRSRSGRSAYIVALNVDAGEKVEGIVHVAAPVTEAQIRKECRAGIKTLRRVEWSSREERIIAVVEERLGALCISAKPFPASDEEASPLLCEVIRTGLCRLAFSKEVRQFQGRVALLKRVFPEESWPDLSDEALATSPEDWLLPWLGGIRTSRGLEALNMLPALRARLSWEQMRLLDERAPKDVTVPSGHRVSLNYTSGDIPVLAVKLQEMFGAADTPEIAEGRVRVLIHLLSPARRPVQITRDLRGFWDTGYPQVKKELMGRYPKHPWPDDPWNAAPTRRTKTKGR